MKKQEVINELRKLNSKLRNKKYLKLEDVRSVPKLGYYAYFYFRTLGNALKAAGLRTSHLAAKMSVSNEDLLNYLRDLKKELDRELKVQDIQFDRKVYKKYSDRPFSWVIFRKRFGGFPKARNLASGNIGPDIKSKRKTSLEINEKEDLELTQAKNRFWGKAAELHVTAELLYRGFQAATIPVDTGLDVLAVKKNKTFLFQVKHQDLSLNNAIKLTKSSFEKSGGGSVYYIFVLLSGEKRDFLIVPFAIVDAWIVEDLAEDNDKNYLLFIKNINGTFMLKEADLSRYLNRWELIK